MASYRTGFGGAYVCNCPNPHGSLHFNGSTFLGCDGCYKAAPLAHVATCPECATPAPAERGSPDDE